MGNSDLCRVGRKPRDSLFHRSSTTTWVVILAVSWASGQRQRSVEATAKHEETAREERVGSSSARERVKTKRRKRSARLGGKVETEVQGGDAVGIVENAEGDGVGVVGEHAVEIGGVDHDAGRFLESSLVEHAEEELELAGDADGLRAGVGEDAAVQRTQRPEEEDLRVEEAVGDVVLQTDEMSAAM